MNIHRKQLSGALVLLFLAADAKRAIVERHQSVVRIYNATECPGSCGATTYDCCPQHTLCNGCPWCEYSANAPDRIAELCEQAYGPVGAASLIEDADASEDCPLSCSATTYDCCPQRPRCNGCVWCKYTDNAQDRIKDICDAVYPSEIKDEVASLLSLKEEKFVVNASSEAECPGSCSATTYDCCPQRPRCNGCDWCKLPDNAPDRIQELCEDMYGKTEMKDEVASLLSLKTSVKEAEGKMDTEGEAASLMSLEDDANARDGCPGSCGATTYDCCPQHTLCNGCPWCEYSANAPDRIAELCEQAYGPVA